MATYFQSQESQRWAHEALYHRLMAEPEVGSELIEVAFAQAEARNDLAEAETLLQIASEAAIDRGRPLPILHLWTRLDRALLKIDPTSSSLSFDSSEAQSEKVTDDVRQRFSPEGSSSTEESEEAFTGDATIEDLLSKFGDTSARDRKRRSDEEDNQDRYTRRQRDAIRRTLQQMGDDD